jgi:hypothetical protein
MWIETPPWKGGESAFDDAEVGRFFLTFDRIMLSVGVQKTRMATG